VTEARGVSGLLEQAFSEARFSCAGAGDELDRDVDVEPLVMCHPHLTHPTRTQRAQEFVLVGDDQPGDVVGDAPPRERAGLDTWLVEHDFRSAQEALRRWLTQRADTSGVPGLTPLGVAKRFVRHWRRGRVASALSSLGHTSHPGSSVTRGGDSRPMNRFLPQCGVPR